MLKDLLKEGGLYTLANFLTKGISLLLIPFYTAYFSPADYGVIDLLALFGSFMINIFMLQLNRGLSRHVAEPTLSKKEKILYASTAIWASVLLLILIACSLTVAQNSIIDYLSGEVRISNRTYLLAISSIVLNALFYLLGVYLRSLRKSKEFAIMSFVHALFGVLLVLLFVTKFDFGIDSVYISYIILVPILIIIEVVLLRDQIKLVFNLTALKELLKYSMPLIPASIAVIIMNFSDRIYIKEYLDFTELGIYAIGTKFATIIGLIITGFTMASAPLIIENQYKENVKFELEKIFNIFISFGTIGVLALTLFSEEIILLFTNENFHSASDVMPLMFLTAYFVGFAIFSQGLNLQKKTIVSAILVISFAFINVFLNRYLIPIYGITGAALATFISTLSYQLILLFISRRYFCFPIKKIKIFIISILHIGLILVFMNLNIELNLLGFAFKIMIIVLYILLLFKVKLLSLKSVLNLIDRKDS